ncbi:MAG TPA: T9SS type A sorting domain-containing protein, partial [Chitinophagales bacterium]|nr:T9SS type A sorting domain-containing protein [Chitinophagales bacterium]
NANSKGCDSTITLNLTVNLVPSTPEITQSNDTLHSNVIISGASYEWYKGGVLLITTSSPFYKFTSNGTYTLRIINNDCASLLSASVNAALPTSVKTIKLDIQFDIIPNPNNGLFEVKIIVPKSGKYDLVLYNVAGQQLINEQLFIQQGSNVKRFNLDGIEKGMYFISVRGNDGISTKNIIVQ